MFMLCVPDYCRLWRQCFHGVACLMSLNRFFITRHTQCTWHTFPGAPAPAISLSAQGFLQEEHDDTQQICCSAKRNIDCNDGVRTSGQDTETGLRVR